MPCMVDENSSELHASKREGCICEICHKYFLPNKYHPNQKICSSLECQYQRQLNNMKKWRNRNPKYFRYREARDGSWKATCRERSRKWREKHSDYLKLYRQENRDRHRSYMREYMRAYRKRKEAEKKANENKNANGLQQNDNIEKNGGQGSSGGGSIPE